MSKRRVTIWGDLVGRYLIIESGPDGRLVLEPDPAGTAVDLPSVTDRVQQASAQGRPALDAFLASLEFSEDVFLELQLVANRNDEVALALARWVRANVL